MNLASRLLQRTLRLSPPLTRDLSVERDLPVPMRDGAVLLADRWSPSAGPDVGTEGLPTALIRTPYGRSGLFGRLMARPLAERGFQVLVQSTRGTYGSGGDFDPIRCERDDGLDTLDWLVKQPWLGSAVVLFGASYLGYAQWAVADRLPPVVKAMVPVVTESALTLEFMRPDGFALELPLAWGIQVDGQESRSAILNRLLTNRRVRRAVTTLPLERADVAALGHQSSYIQNVLAHTADSPYWVVVDHSRRVAEVGVPVSSVGGWYDIFLPGQLRDFQALQAAGHRSARLTIGPWTHAAPGVQAAGIRELLEFGLPVARGEEPPERAPVRLYVQGEEAWRDFPAWPPPGYEPRRFFLQAFGGLAEAPGEPSGPDGYSYDPADPTPAAGGIGLFGVVGKVDNRLLEARPDVLTYTTEVLDADVEVIGEVTAEIWFRSSLPYADVFVRLCDVDARGRSYNVCDGLVSLTGADSLTCAVVRLWPTAYRFPRGHRIRVQVSSGAFPRYNRNPGTGDPRATATTLRTASQHVFHDAEHPSAVILPVRLA